MKTLSLGAATIALASGLRVIVQVAVLPVIGRVLGPHVYGQMALVAPFIFFSMMIAESGLGACIVRAAVVTPALKGTVFCFSACLSLVFMAGFAAVARPLGAYLQEPMFPGLLMGMSSIMLLASLNIVPAACLLRDKRYHWIAASDLASIAGSLAGVGLGIALHWGAWSLVAQQIGLWACKLIVVCMGARFVPPPTFRWSVLKENMQFGSRLTASGIIAFLARNIDNVLIGRFMGAQVLGFYALAFQIVGMPQMVVSGSVYFTLFAGTSEAVRSGVSPKAQFLTVLRGIILLCMPAVVGLAATASLSIPLIMGTEWMPSAWLIVLLVPLGLCQTVGAAMAGVLNGLGRSDTLLKAELVSSIATILAILGGVALGANAVAIGVSLTALTFPVIAMRVIARQCGIRAREVVQAIGSPIAASLVMGAAIVGLERSLPDTLPRLAEFMICVAAGALLYAAILSLVFRDRLLADLGDIRFVLRRQKGDA